MARDISSTALNELSKNLGTEPIIIIDVEWVNGTVTRYADKNLPNIEGKITQLTNLDEVIKVTGGGTSTALSVTLDDTDGTIKNLMKGIDIHKRPCTVYQYFDGIPIEDAFIIMRGEVLSPISWSEADRSVSFDIVSEIDSNEVGFSPEEGNFEHVPDELAGRVWPLAFGDVVHVPATKAGQTLTGQSKTLFGLPDVTLPLKRQLIELKIETLKQTHQYYLNVINQLRSVTKPPLLILDEYVDTIIDEDDLKQRHEDGVEPVEMHNATVDNLVERYHSLEEEGAEEAELNNLKEQIKEAIKDRDERQYELEEIIQDLMKADYDKKSLEMDANNRKLAFDSVSRVRQQIRRNLEEIYNLQRELFEIGKVTINQSILFRDSVPITNSENFPEGNVVLDIEGRLVLGSFNNGMFNIQTIIPNFFNIHVSSTRFDPDIDAFWITNPNINLDGMYALTTSRDIIKITGQEGTKCSIELSNKQDNRRQRHRGFESDGRISGLLGNLLTGDESPQEIVQIINEIPRKLSFNTWEKLSGDGRTFVIKATEHVEGGTFKIIYDGFESRPISYSSVNADRIHTELMRMPVLFDHRDDIEVDGDDLDDGIKITFPRQMVRHIGVDSDNIFGEAIEDEDGDPIQVQGRTLRHGAYVYVQVVSDGANEYTTHEIERILEDAIAKSTYGEALNQTKDGLRTYFDLMQEAENSDEFEAVLGSLGKNLETYKKIIKKMELPHSVVEEAFRLISDQEYEKLLDLEVLHYMEWRESFEEFDPQADELENYSLTGHDVHGLLEVAPMVLPHWVQNIPPFGEEFVEGVQKLPSSSAWAVNIGTEVKLHGDFQEKYIANILPSEVKSVHAYRNIDGRRTLVPVPSRYYIKNENEDHGEYNTTSIYLRRPLSEYDDEHWEDDIFVTMSSSIGPNTADILKWIAERYTDLTVDSESFNHVKAKVENYPSSFALFDKRDALSLIEDIAWQARCNVWVKDKKLFFKYLPEEPTPVDTITESDVEEDSLILSLSSSEDIVTKFIANWRANYTQSEDNQVILRHNVTKYKEKEGDHNFFIYNIKSLVQKSATFWLIHECNTWKLISFSTFLTKLKLEVNDCVLLDFSDDYFSNEPVKAIIQRADYDSATNTIQIDCWIPIRSGDMEPYKFAWPSEISVDFKFPEEDDVLSGNAGSPVNNRSPGGVTFEPLEPPQFRPSDYGDIEPTDLNDSMPQSPIADFFEIDYEDVETKDVKVPEDRKEEHALEYNSIIDGESKVAESKSLERSTGKNATYTAIGRVDSLHSVDDENETNISQQYYWVFLPDGRKVKVKQMQIHKDERIPRGTSTYVVFNADKHEYQMQVPVWIGEHIDLSDDDEETA